MVHNDFETGASSKMCLYIVHHKQNVTKQGVYYADPDGTICITVNVLQVRKFRWHFNFARTSNLLSKNAAKEEVYVT